LTWEEETEGEGGPFFDDDDVRLDDDLERLDRMDDDLVELMDEDFLVELMDDDEDDFLAELMEDDDLRLEDGLGLLSAVTFLPFLIWICVASISNATTCAMAFSAFRTVGP